MSRNTNGLDAGRVSRDERVVIVCGGRTFTDFYQLREVLDSKRSGISKVITGGGRGADGLAIQWATENNIEVEVFEADWQQFKKAAGPIRNKRMVRESGASLVIAFAGGRGTHGICELATREGLDVERVPPREAGRAEPSVSHAPAVPVQAKRLEGSERFGAIVQAEERARSTGSGIGRAIADEVIAEIEAAASAV